MESIETMILTFIGVLAAVYGAYWAYKSFKLTSNKNDLEKWDYLLNQLDCLKQKDRISQTLLMKSISFFKGISFGEIYVIAKFSIQNNISLWELNDLLKLRKKGYLKYSYKENYLIKIRLNSKAKSKFSMIFDSSRVFEKFSWLMFILFHFYLLYTIIYYDYDIVPYYNSNFNHIGIGYLIILMITEVLVLVKVDTRETIERFLMKNN